VILTIDCLLANFTLQDRASQSPALAPLPAAVDELKIGFSRLEHPNLKRT
jgi:hypothetical protein